MKIGVTLCVLNEELYIGACLRALIASPHIHKIAVVESCCKHNEHAGNAWGLSVDNTAEEIRRVMAIDFDKKILFEQYGFSRGKTESQNRALELVRDGMDYILAVDGDEIWKTTDIEKMVHFLAFNPQVNSVKVRMLNFWKRPDIIRFGKTWEPKPVRLFRNFPGIKWNIHDAPVILEDGRMIHTVGECADPGFVFYHYGYVKPEKNVQNKIDFYSKRGGKKIGNTYPLLDGEITKDPSAKEGFKYFDGEHPKEFAAIKYHAQQKEV
jgi:glycosyltransferase involved in cell wall biosynthesis